MTNSKPGSEALDVIISCRAADFSVLNITVPSLKRFISSRRVYVVTANRNFAGFRRKLGDAITLLDEDTMIPGMKLATLRKLSLPGFPQGAGWYFQQLLKIAFCFHKIEDDYYLIWDADTIPLRPLEFFDSSGHMLLTTANEEHAPYFETYRRLLGEEPNRDFSFIAQHMIVQKSIAREMLAAIESNLGSDYSWAWTIMRNIYPESRNSFSEYETLGHYTKNHYPERVAYRQLNWLREGALQNYGLPTPATLNRLAQKYDFVAFESSQMPLRRFVRKFYKWLGGLGIGRAEELRTGPEKGVEPTGKESGPE